MLLHRARPHNPPPPLLPCCCSQLESGSGGPVSTWIVKPSAGTQGRGITLVQTAAHLVAADVSGSVAQQYVDRPLLLDGGLKFDLRIYALVASVDPLRIYLFDEGLARLATQPYAHPAAAPEHLGTAHMHLTNYAVNRNAPGFASSAASLGNLAANVRSVGWVGTCGSYS